jgi:hypothetical protein
MQKRYIGPANPDGPDGDDAGHEVLVAGRKLGNVKHGDVIDVPDDLVQEVAWPESEWEDVKAAAPAKRKSEGA